MFICRYIDSDTEGGRPGYGRLERSIDGDTVVPVVHDRAAGRWVDGTGRERPLAEVTLLPPAEPSKIACLALNRAPDGHAPVGDRRPTGSASCAVVLKPPSSLTGSGDTVRHPGAEWELKYEAELAVVIGTRCTRVPPSGAARVVAGYTCANDLTAYAKPSADGSEDAGRTGFPAVWAKHFDGFTPLGPWLATDFDPADAEIICTVDGETVQRAGTRDLLTPVPEVIAAVSEHMTLLPGDVILTGTPAASGPLLVGSRVEVAIADIGTLTTTIGMPGERKNER
ncbi:fumarylacetoacetate hydrolase family protein [Streptomyces sp. ISL-100]|uniref:fumarylacetoacetate hydrolase family protein n=1 Tax=Streptomyces sp. ISL-100 TaxID=2819173 RepID=UPI001BE93D42|nr:fumarylacetoacetate hydrolase family protein [Streptomyces sp. ISL-100]MBT2399848.1 fumarylacetoacetate hydrolase family protein [Streptomyces sp. ISL-100]